LVLVETALLVVQDQPTMEVMVQILYLVPSLQQVVVVAQPTMVGRVILGIAVVLVAVVLTIQQTPVLVALERQTKDMLEEMELLRYFPQMQMLVAAAALEV
jgi:hypothetical protein